MLEAIIGIGLLWLFWKLVCYSLNKADRDCEIARLQAISRIVADEESRKTK